MGVPCRKPRQGSLALMTHRLAKYHCRGRRRCNKIGHWWNLEFGWMQINGVTVESTRGNLCIRCGFYVERDL